MVIPLRNGISKVTNPCDSAFNPAILHNMNTQFFNAMTLLVVIGGLQQAGQTATQQRPNIVLILCDDLGYADVGFNGSQDISTPELDRLAGAGTVCSSAYVAHPFCGPSRAGLLSGRYPHVMGAQFNLPEHGEDIEEGIPVGETLISDVLHDSGYFTGLIGKWHLGESSQFHPNLRGFDDFYGFLGGGHNYFPAQFMAEYKRRVRAGARNIWSYLTPLEHNGKEVEETEYITDALSREGVRFIREAGNRDQPFFLYLSYNAPHTPLEAKEEDLKRVTGITDKDRRTYAAMVYAVDRGVAKVVEALKTTGQFDNTLIVFLSDNGGRTDAGASNAPLTGAKGDTWEGGFRVPMFFHWPHVVPAGKRYEHPISSLDFFPTFAALGGAAIPSNKNLDGKDIWDDLLAGRSPRKGETIFALRHRSENNDVGARRDQWKVYRSGKRRWQLFNIDDDISEQHDISGQHPEQVESMVRELERWSRSHVEPRWFDNPKAANNWVAKGMPNYAVTFEVTRSKGSVRRRSESQNDSADGKGANHKDANHKGANHKDANHKDVRGSEIEASNRVHIDAESSDLLYFESFDVDPGYIGAKGPNDNNISSIAYGTTGSLAQGPRSVPNVKAGEYAGTSQYLAGTKVLGSTGNGRFSIGSNGPVQGKSRNRSYATFIDTSSAVVGQYKLSFDVSDFQSSGSNTSLYLHLFEGRDTDSGRLEFQVTFQTLLPELAPSLPGITGKGAKISHILVDNEITGDGQFSLNFGLSEAGQPGDFLALMWSQVKRGGAEAMPSMAIDNVAVSLLPPPADASITDSEIGSNPVGQSGEWKLREDLSDEFNTSQINPRKWNNHPASWGAWSWDESNTNQATGKLRIEMVHEPHLRNDRKLFYKSGIVRSHAQITYGYFEARIKGCSLFPGACPAFWMYSDGRKYSGEVRYCEVDFVELQMNELNPETNQRDPVQHIDMNLHLRLMDETGKEKWVRPNSNPDMCAHSWMAPWDPRDDFHIYGCNVTPQMITWYIDGEAVANEENTYWHLPMNVTLSLGLRHPHIGWQGQNIWPVPQAATGEGFPTAMEVDYVRIWEKK